MVGENGTGKTHILKLAYACIHVMHQDSIKAVLSTPLIPQLKSAVAAKLLAVFKPDELGRLARRSRRGNNARK